jgi:uncharacterized protein (DUF58 family)
MTRSPVVFTMRGRAFAAAGLSVLACGLLLGQRDLVRLAGLIMALPALAWVVVPWLPSPIRVDRTVRPRQVQPSAEISVRLELFGASRFSSGPWLAVDTVPTQLGGRPHFSVGRLSSQRPLAVNYSIRADARGRWQIGPLQMVLADPFRMVESARDIQPAGDVVVLPRVAALTGALMTGHAAAVGETSAGMTAGAGDHDLTVREYRHGDDLRRVHWKSTARHNELMVRTDEQPLRRRATVVVDLRAMAHHGQGPSSSLEWAISAAASFCVHLAHQDYRVRLALPGGDVMGTKEQLAALATIRAQGRDALAAAIRTTDIGHRGDQGVVLAVLGDLSPDAVAALGKLGHQAQRSIAWCLDTRQWSNAGQLRASAGQPRGSQEGPLGAAMAQLTGYGWLTVPVRPRTTVPDAWEQATAMVDSRRAVPPAGARP